jgi:hypothetical protein
MSQVYLSADYVLARTIQLMNDTSIDLMRVPAPKPVIFPAPKNKRKKLSRKLTYKMSHAERAEYEESLKPVFPPMLLWGPIERPDFVIDESELPY